MATAELNRERGKIVIDSTYAERDVIAKVPGAKWVREFSHWEVPHTWAACLQLRGLFGQRLELGPELTEWAWEVRTRHIQPAERLRLALTDEGFDDIPMVKDVNRALDAIENDSELKLKPFQRVDVMYLVGAERAVLANPMGLGKSPVTVRTLQVLDELGEDPFPAVVICPNSLKNTVWANEFAKWAPELKVQVIDGSAGKRRKQFAEKVDVYVINWDSVRLHSRLGSYGTIKLTDAQKAPKELNELNPHTVVMDEAHRMREPNSQQTRATWAVAHQAQFRFALTGTPVNNHVGDVWGLLHCVQPAWFPAKTKFLDRYAETMFGLFGGMEVLGLRAETEAEFRAITNPLMRRLPKEAALPQLPKKRPVMYRETPMTPKQAKAYQQMESDLVASLNELVVAPNPLSQLTRLLQFAAASAEVDETGQLHLANPSNKVDDLVELLGEMGDEPLVVAAVSRQLIELAAARLDKEKITYGLITGAVAPIDRATAVTRFQEGRNRVIMLTLGAGAEGLTLTRANTMLFMQESFSPLENSQAEDRIHRIGAEVHDHVQVIKQVTPGTVEYRKQAQLEKKAVRIEEVVRDRDALKRLLGAL
jgi:SNF2 family DNA or RNA helicase